MEEGLRDIKPLVPVPLGPAWWEIALWVLLGVAVLVGAWLWWKRRSRAPEPVAPPEPADVIALRALRAVRLVDGADIAIVRKYYFEISSIVRTYVEARFGLNATDLTTEEILQMLRDAREVREDARMDLRAFLLASDAVKFAKRDPSPDDIAGVYSLAERFVVTTRHEVLSQSA